MKNIFIILDYLLVAVRENVTFKRINQKGDRRSVGEKIILSTR